jgi:hypothetical protein
VSIAVDMAGGARGRRGLLGASSTRYGRLEWLLLNLIEWRRGKAFGASSWGLRASMGVEVYWRLAVQGRASVVGGLC